MALVKLILDIKDQAWIDAHATKVLLLNEPIYRDDGMVAYGDNVTQLQNLVFKPLFSGGGSWGTITGDIEDQQDLVDYIAAHAINPGTVQYVNQAPSATPNSTDYMVVATTLVEDFLLHAPPINFDGKEFILRVKDGGVSINLAFDPAYRFSSDIPAVSQTTPFGVLYFHFIFNDEDNLWDCIDIENNFGAQVIPPPPYVIGSVTSITGLDQGAGLGPSNPSNGFSVSSLGLDGGIGSGDITMNFPTNFEGSDDNGSTWSTNPVLIHYVNGAVTTPSKYKVRTQGGLPTGNYSGDITFTVNDVTATIQNISVSGEITASAFDVDALIFFTYLTPQPSLTQKLIYNDVFLSLKRTGNWAGLDRFWITATEFQQHARISLKNPGSSALSEVNSPAWTQYQGYRGDGATSYIETNYSPLESSVFLQNDASFGSYSRSDIQSVDMCDVGVLNSTGSNSGLYLNSRNTSNNLGTIFNANTAIEFAGTVLDSRGFTSLVRSSTSSKKLYKNGILLVDTASSSTGRSAETVTILAYKYINIMNSFSQRQLSSVFFGNSSVDQLSLYNTIQSYMTALGTQV